jgi:pullulanase
MKKIRLLFILMLTIIGVTVAQNVSVHASEANTLIVHYHRFDPNYSGWSLWLWPYQPTPGDGANYAFTGEDDFGKVLELDLETSPFASSSSIGVIVRDGSWNKDVAIDRFIDLTSPNASGEVHVYLVSGDETIYYDDDNIDISHRASNVNFMSTTEIAFQSSKELSQSDITVYENDTPLDFSGFVSQGGSVSLELNQGIELTNEYTITINFNEDGVAPKTYKIGYTGLYSTDEFNDVYAYDGELGALYSADSTTFKLWAPISSNVSVNLYNQSHTSTQTDYDGVAGEDDPYETIDMSLQEKGVWEVTVDGDLHGVYYTFNVTNSGSTYEVSDPYAYGTGINGLRSMVVDFDRLDPDNWDDTAIPDTIGSYNDAIIYELHVRDFTTHSSWNGTDDYRGKFLGLTETGTTYQGVTTGLDHIIELGVTHVQLLPVFDYGAAVDETRLNDPSYQGAKDTIFNWGYMPENFNSVEGSYSTNPYDGSTRITEFKSLIQTFHENGIRVIMDVVYNHHGRSADANFDLIVPGYYFRKTEDGQFSNGSGTGNETASENYMMSKFIVDSTKFWAEEYNISGFRFDLMKLHDVDTMNAVADTLHDIDDTIMVYGEPWTGGTSLLPDALSAYKGTLDEMPGVAVFNDDFRDAIKGSVFDEAGMGFVQGDSSTNAGIRLGIVGATNHFSADLADPWAINPNQSINYVTAHDNNVLYDKLMLSTEELSLQAIKDMQKQANAIVLTSNGIPFLHAGVELMRTKPCVVIDDEPQGECDATLTYDHNSYRSPDETNQIDWQWKVDSIDVFDYYKGLIALRRNINVFSYDSLEEMNEKLFFIPTAGGMVQYMVYDDESAWEYTMVVHNNSVVERSVDLQGYTWNLVVNKDQAGLETIETIEGTVTIAPNETLVMYVLAADAEWPIVEDDIDEPVDEPTVEDEGFLESIPTVVYIVASIAVVGIGVAIIIIRKQG